MVDNKQLEEKLKAFAKDPQKEAFVDILKELEERKLYVPAQADAEGKPAPLLLKTTEQIPILPAFTSMEQIPEERKTQALLEMPYKTCIGLAVNNSDKINAIILNPFTTAFTVNKEAIEVARRRLLNPEESKTTVQMTEQQFHQYALRKMAYDLLPAKVKQSGLGELSAKREKMMLDFALQIYPEQIRCPYSEEDFSVMVLQVSDEVKIARVDLPEKYVGEHLPVRAYLAEKNNGEIRAFAIEKGKKNENNLILEIVGDGECAPVKDVPDSGAEIEMIMEIVG